MMRCLVLEILKKVCKSIYFALSFACLPAVVWGNTLEELQDPFAGFDEIDIVSKPVTKTKKSIFNHFSGYGKFLTVANTTHSSPGPEYRDWHGLSGLKMETLLEANFRFADWKAFTSIKGWYDFAYSLNGRDGYTNSVLDEYEKELELREAYIQGNLSSFIDLKIGRQIVVWGRSDNFRVTDILNPLDNRNLGLVDIENLRLPLAMVKIDIFSGNWNLDLISIHEHRYDQNPPFGHFFYPSTDPLPPEKTPSNTLENMEMAAELSTTFSGWDISFYGAHYFNDQPTFSTTNPTNLEHHQITMVGSSMSLAHGDLLYIAELAHFKRLHFLNNYHKQYNRSELLFGIEYSGLPDTNISLDYVNRHIHHYDDILDSSPEGPKKSENSIALRISRDFIQDTLELSA
ncbi:MAG: DUF1302 domain-containing protein, partial [Desulfobulbaceae bacterium]|nr:DUF1302 domain-containing protein [Desulfobulbaceae bacterium]